MFDATCSVLYTISKKGANYQQRGDAEGAYKVLTLFEFIFILHMMKVIMGITDILCQVLQKKISRHFKCHSFDFHYKITYSKFEREWMGEITC